MSKQDLTDKTLRDLLSGSHPQTKKYAGKQVFVINTEIVPVKQSKKSLSDFKKLKTKYGKSPILIFVPQPGASYMFHQMYGHVYNQILEKLSRQFCLKYLLT